MRILKEKSIYQLTFFPNMFPVNCYLVEEEDSLTLIDAALPFSAKGIIKAANQIGKPITRILLTHAHDDHVGALDTLAQVLPDVPVYISTRDNRLMQGDRSLDSHEPKNPIRGGVSDRMKTKANRLLNDGDQVGSLKAVSAPGHTPGLMAFLDVRDRSLIVGDAFQTRGGIAVAGQLKPFFPFPAFGTWSPELALESARKLRDLQPSLLAVGHGKMILNPITSMERAIVEAEQYFQKKQK